MCPDINVDAGIFWDAMPKESGAARKRAVRLPCACANLRRAGRVVTRYYDAVLRPSGLHTSQFTLLQALQEASEISQKQLAELLEIDSTTLTRTLTPLRRKGWLKSEAGADRRELRLSLTAAGKREYTRALPYWQTAQQGLEQALGKQNWNHLVDAAVRTAEVVLKSGAGPFAIAHGSVHARNHERH
jgi:DNA-binding MarR family transcriptional regulator